MLYVPSDGLTGQNLTKPNHKPNVTQLILHTDKHKIWNTKNMLPIIICDEQIEFKYKIMEFSFRWMTQKTTHKLESNLSPSLYWVYLTV